MKFSIVTPTLNAADFLPDVIASLQAQFHEDYEHIIVDGASTDATMAIAETAARDDKRIHFITREGLGQYAAISAGFEIATGEAFAWLNADDLYMPWTLSVVADFLTRRPDVHWLVGFPGCFDVDKTLRFIRPEGWRPAALIRAGWFHKDLLGFIQQESIFFRAELFTDLSTEDRTTFAGADLAGDFFLWRTFARRAPLVLLPTALAGFRRHGENRSIGAMDDYMTEASAFGAFVPPRLLAHLARAIYQRLAGRYIRRAIDEAERAALNAMQRQRRED